MKTKARHTTRLFSCKTHSGQNDAPTNHCAYMKIEGLFVRKNDAVETRKPN